jgi:hypothetical protein
MRPNAWRTREPKAVDVIPGGLRALMNPNGRSAGGTSLRGHFNTNRSKQSGERGIEGAGDGCAGRTEVTAAAE